MYNYDYNNHGNYNRKPPKGKGSAGAAVTIFVSLLIIAIVTATCFLIYQSVIMKFDKKTLEYQAIIDEYGKKIEERDEEIKLLSNKISTLSSEQMQLTNTVLKSETDKENSGSINSFNIAKVVQTVSPSVIGIKITVPMTTSSFWSIQQYDATAEGSGIILTADGYIATNYHVVEYCTQYKDAILEVKLADGTVHTAKYIGGDEINDLAVIKIDASNLPYATLGSSKESNVGDFVIAIGNPVNSNLYGSVTFGIISGLDRKVETENVAEQLIQTDAAINPGNSGGALINSKGEIIGINTIKISMTGIEGIGFAIPMEYAEPILNSLMEYGYVKGRPTLGFSGSEISKNVARVYGVPQGVIVSETYAENKTLVRNDIITAINDTTVNTLSDINEIIKEKNIGEKVTVTIWRDGKLQNVTATILELKS